ncbi:hypothetical protein CPB86DRAFT_780672, partial [Serendipita vermifera]
MSARRARVQYGKTSKRIHSRVRAETSVTDEHTIEIEDGNQKPEYMEEESRVKTSFKIKTDLPAMTLIQGKPQESPTRKRKRSKSLADSDTSEGAEEGIVHKISKRASAAMATPKKPIPAIGKETASEQRTPVRPSTPSNTGSQTPRIAKDLSDLFISPHKASVVNMNIGSPQKGGHLKHMLSKSKTESALEHASTPSRELFPSKSISTPFTSPQKSSGSMDFSTNSGISPFILEQSQKDRTPSPPPNQSTRSPQRPGRTYSKSRSFLIEIPRDKDEMDLDKQKGEINGEQNPGLDDLDVHRESYSELRSRWGVDDSENDPLLNVPINELNSIGEMRSKGETRRFLDEVSYLLDGLDPNAPNGSKGARRASAMEIISKMSDSEFQRRAAAADFVGKAWTALRGAKAGGGDDKVLDAALLIFAVIAMRGLRHASDLSRMEDVVELFCTSMEISPDDDILLPPPEEAEEGDGKTQRFSKSELSWARKLGLSKSDMTNLAMLRTSVQNSQVVLPDQTASHRLLASESLVKLSETGYPLPSIVTQSAVKGLVEELSQLSEANEDFKPDRRVDFRHIYNCMRLLDGTNIQKHLTTARDADELLKNLVANLAHYIGLWPGKLPSLYDLDESMELALRLLITITSDDVEMSESLSSEPNIIHNLLRLFVRWYKKKFHSTDGNPKSKKGKKKRESDIEADPEIEEVPNLLERVSMSLGLVTQLAKQVDSAKQHILDTWFSASCPGLAECAEICQCKGSVPALQSVTEIFYQSTNSLSGEAEAQAHFLHGHLGILLAVLCTHDSSSRSQVLPYLRPRKGSAKDKIRSLVEVVREFSSLLSTVVNKANERSSPEDEEYVGEVASDEGVLLAQTMVRKLESLL